MFISILWSSYHLSFFFFNDPPPTEIYTLSLHDALPISQLGSDIACRPAFHPTDPNIIYASSSGRLKISRDRGDRKSTRLNSSHGYISYAVFCLKKKKKKKK